MVAEREEAVQAAICAEGEGFTSSSDPGQGNVGKRTQDVLDRAFCPVKMADGKSYTWTPHAVRGAFYTKCKRMGLEFEMFNANRSSWKSEATPQARYLYGLRVGLSERIWARDKPVEAVLRKKLNLRQGGEA